MSILYENVVKNTNYATTYYFEDLRDLSDWTLRIQLRNKETSLIVNSIDRSVVTTIEGNTKFVLNLTPVELDIDEGNYVLGAQLENTTTSELAEVINYLKIIKQWVYD